jgi:poly-beta-1,6-N-acetyl-D-glucosamine synthase
VLEKRGDWLDVLLDFDNLFSAIVAAAPTMIGFPISGVGRNMAFRRDAYESIGGYPALTHYRSGDDIHLTERMRDKSKGKIIYCADPESFVHTKPPDTVREIFYQQIRKNSKIMDKSLKSVTFSVFLFIVLMLYILIPFVNPAWLGIWLILLGVKLILEFVGLLISAFIFKAQRLIPWFPLIQLFYPIYVTIFGILGMFHLYKWK